MARKRQRKPRKARTSSQAAAASSDAQTGPSSHASSKPSSTVATASATTTSRPGTFPVEIWLMIMARLDYGGAFCLRQVNRFFKEAVDLRPFSTLERHLFLSQVERYQRYMPKWPHDPRSPTASFACTSCRRIRPATSFADGELRRAGKAVLARAIASTLAGRPIHPRERMCLRCGPKSGFTWQGKKCHMAVCQGCSRWVIFEGGRGTLCMYAAHLCKDCTTTGVFWQRNPEYVFRSFTRRASRPECVEAGRLEGRNYARI